MALVVNDRVKETSTTAGTGTLDLDGAVTGFVTFVAGIGDTNTTYYAIFEQGTANWETGVGTVTDAATDTLARTTVLSNSLGSTAKISFGGTLDVFCTLPASQVVFGKQQGTNFTDSLLVGHSTTGTLSSATNNTGVGIEALDALTSGGDNTAVGRRALTTVTIGTKNTAVGQNASKLLLDSTENVAVGYNALRTNSTGDNNTAVGSNALYTNSAGHNNTGIGRDSLKLTTGDYNTVLGYRAGDNISSGDGNVIIGSVDATSATGDRQLMITGYDGTTTTTWIQGESTGNTEVAVNWNPSLSTTGKAFVMGF